MEAFERRKSSIICMILISEHQDRQLVTICSIETQVTKGLQEAVEDICSIKKWISWINVCRGTSRTFAQVEAR